MTTTSKYNAQPSGGFDSKLEERRYYQLKANPHVTDIKVHPVFEIFPKTLKCQKCKIVLDRGIAASSCPHCKTKLLVFRGISYIADFQVTYDDGRIVIEDVKGVETEAFRLKRKMFEAAYPHLTLSIVRSSDMKQDRIMRKAMKNGVP